MLIHPRDLSPHSHVLSEHAIDSVDIITAHLVVEQTILLGGLDCQATSPVVDVASELLICALELMPSQCRHEHSTRGPGSDSPGCC